MICETCNETAPDPLETVNLTQTVLHLGADMIQHEWSGVGTGAQLAWTMDAVFLKIDFVAVGQAVQPDDAYTIVSDVLTLDDAPADGENVTVRGLIAAP
jgi:hypothetical protein